MASKGLFKKISLSILLAGIVFSTFLAPLGNIARAETNPLSFSGTNAEVDEEATYLPGCTITTIGTGCIVQALYYIVYVPSHALTYVAGVFLDIFLKYSINNESYNQNGFVEKGWSIVRDLTNIIFIFGLLVVAFGLVLDLQILGNPKKILINIIVIGLLMNFSLFLTKVIVDAGNVLATVFYNQMTVTKNGESTVGLTGEAEISLALLNQSNPQKIFANTISGSTGVYATVIIAAAAFNIGLMIMFFSVGFLFVGRVVGLMVQMILSPLAFVSKIIPFKGALGKYSFDNWFRETLKISFMAPVFLFFLYLIILFLKAKNALGLNDGIGGDPITLIITIFLPYVFTYTLVAVAKKQAKEMAGEVGNMVASTLTKVTAVVGGAAIAAVAAPVAAGAVSTVGAAGARLAASQAGKTGAAARTKAALGKRLASSSFDFRSTKLGGKLGQQLGKQQIKELGIKGSFGKPSQTTYLSKQEEFIKKEAEKAKAFAEIKPTEKEAIDVRNRKAELHLANEIKDDNHKWISEQLEKSSKRIEDANKKVSEAKATGDPAIVKEAQAELNTLRDFKTTLTAALNKTEKQKKIMKATENLDAADKAYSAKEKERKLAYANEVVKQNASYKLGVSQTSVDEAIQKIKGEPDKKKGKVGEETFKQEELTTLKDIADKLDTQIKNNKEAARKQAELEKQKKINETAAKEQLKRGYGSAYTTSTTGTGFTSTQTKTTQQTQQPKNIDDSDNSGGDNTNPDLGDNKGPITPPKQ